jgi:hypothetical protein
MFFKYFTTVLITCLLFGSLVLAVPMTKGTKPSSIETGHVYQAKVNKTEPKAGKSKDGRHPMIVLGKPNEHGHLPVGIVTHAENVGGPGTTKPATAFGLPDNSGHVRVTKHTVHKDELEHLKDDHPLHGHIMGGSHIDALKEATGHSTLRPQNLLLRELIYPHTSVVVVLSHQETSVYPCTEGVLRVNAQKTSQIQLPEGDSPST